MRARVRTRMCVIFCLEFPPHVFVSPASFLCTQASNITEKDPERCRVRRTNAFGEGMGRPCENEAVTVTKEGIFNGNLVWVEDGVVLRKGMVLMKMWAWVPECADAVIAAIPPGTFPKIPSGKTWLLSPSLHECV